MRPGAIPTREREATEKTAALIKSTTIRFHEAIQERIDSNSHGELVVKVRFQFGHITQATIGGEEYVHV